MITIFKDRLLKFKGGYILCSAQIENEGYIADLYVNAEKNDYRLYDDTVFVNSVMRELKKHGYEGESFGVAELDLQSFDTIVLDPSEDFENWVVEKFGFKLLDEKSIEV